MWRKFILSNLFTSLFPAIAIALTGLVTNSSALVIAAMLINPLGGQLQETIVSMVDKKRGFSTKVSNQYMDHIFYVIITIFMGFLVGMSVKDVETDEVDSRTNWNFMPVLITATAASWVLGVASKSPSTNASVGFGIAISLLPPLLVCGLMLGKWVKAGRKRADIHRAASAFGLYFLNVLIMIVITSTVYDLMI